jgi:hypothetical protein
MKGINYETPHKQYAILSILLLISLPEFRILAAALLFP